MFEQKLNELFDNTKPIKVEHNTQYFNLPIEYIEHNQINDIIKEDIEFKGKNHIYNTILPESILNDKWSSIYTTNKDFLKPTTINISIPSFMAFSCAVILSVFLLLFSPSFFYALFKLFTYII